MLNQIPSVGIGMSYIDRAAIERFNSLVSFDDATPVLVSFAERLFPGQAQRIARSYFVRMWEMRPSEAISPGATVPLKDLVRGGLPRSALVVGLQKAALARLR